MKLLPLCCGLSLLMAPCGRSQFFDPSVEINTTPTPASGGGNNQKGTSDGKPKMDLPSFDPGSEVLSFDGKLWNVTNNRLFHARFEKYLAAPESPVAEDAAYCKILDEVLAAISPTRPGGPDLPRAVALLPIAAQSPIDARLCDALANTIYTVWVSKKSSQELTRADAAHQNALSDLHRNVDLSLQSVSAPGARALVKGTAAPIKPENAGTITNYVRRIAELEAIRTAASARRELTELESKLQYQYITVQFFLQRRFEHVVLSCRINRILFGATD